MDQLTDNEDIENFQSNSHVFYDGYQILEPIGGIIGMGVDRVNYIFCLLLGFAIAYGFRTNLGRADRETRAFFTASVGFAMIYFCFGRAVVHLVLNTSIGYLLLKYSSPKNVHIVVLCFSMGYLTWVHAYRWLYQKSYILDVTGPMMIAVSKVTLLATAVHDGQGADKVTAEQKRDSLSEVPSLLDYLSYMFNFQSVLSGPTNHYADWSAFLDGQHRKSDPNTSIGDPTRVAIQKFQLGLLLILIVAVTAPFFDMAFLATPEYTELPVWRWLIWLYLTAQAARIPYFAAWSLADSICNMSGFGYSGKDKKTGEDVWELTTNVKIYNVEMGLNFKETIDSWNITTVAWLRRTVYERFEEKYRTVAVYLVCAAWHGLSFGYYIACLTSALFTLSANTFRRCMRHRFLSPPISKQIYDFVGFVATRFVACYIAYPFFTMDFWPSLFAFRQIYFIPHLIAGFNHFILPSIAPPPPRNKRADSTQEDVTLSSKSSTGRRSKKTG